MLLPVVERELRVAARQPATHWARFGAAAAAMLVVLFPLLSEGGVSRQTGGTLFALLSVLTLIACALAGVFLSATPLSRKAQVRVV